MVQGRVALQIACPTATAGYPDAQPLLSTGPTSIQPTKPFKPPSLGSPLNIRHLCSSITELSIGFLAQLKDILPAEQRLSSSARQPVSTSSDNETRGSSHPVIPFKRIEQMNKRHRLRSLPIFEKVNILPSAPPA